MPTVDAFNSDLFSMRSLTAAIAKAPYKPKLLGMLGIFVPKPVTTSLVEVEEKEGKLSLLYTGTRGSMPTASARTSAPRKARSFKIPHVPQFQSVLSDDIQNIRAFGSETELETLMDHVNDQLIGMRENHETTHEYHRVGALKGAILDADGSTSIYNLYTEFGTSQQTSDFTGTNADVKSTTNDVIRKIATALGNQPFGQIYALCGNTYFDAVCAHSSVKTAYTDWQKGEYLRVAQLGPEWYSVAMNGFMYGGVMFINYRGVIGDVTFIPDTEAYYFPTGVPNMFQAIIGPGDTDDTVNTKGRLIYAFQERMEFGKGIKLHTQSNVLMMNTRPRAVIKSTYSAS